MEEYDVVIAGGSISGLMSAREIAKKGQSVLVARVPLDLQLSVQLFLAQSTILRTIQDWIS